MRTKPFTTSEFFNLICTILKESSEFPDILDYALASSKSYDIPTEEFSLRHVLDYGGSEGIYLDMYLVRYDDEALRNEIPDYHLGTFKTLDSSKEAMRTMGVLLADFIVESTDFVNKNLEDFNWLGYDIYPSDEEGNNISNYHITCSSECRVNDRAEKLLENNDYVTIRNNATRESKTISASQNRPLSR